MRARVKVRVRVRVRVLGADGLDLGSRLLVRQHRELRPQVVLDLEVEPTVEEVVTVGAEAVHLAALAVARTEVDAGNDLAHEEGATLGYDREVELVQVLAGVVGRDDEEGVQVGDHVGEGDVDEGVGIEGAPEKQERRGHQKEAEREVRAHDLVRVLGLGLGLRLGLGF